MFSLSTFDGRSSALLHSLIQMIVVGGLEIYIFIQIHSYGVSAFQSQNGTQPFVLVYYGLFLLAQLFQFILVADAVRNKNTIQIIAVSLFNVGCFIYTLVQIFQLKSLRDCAQTASPNALTCPPNQTNSTKYIPTLDALFPYFITVSILQGISSLIGIMLSYHVYRLFGWLIYQKSGASIQTKRMITLYHFFIMMLKLNIYFTIAILIQLVIAYHYYKVTNGSNSSAILSLLPMSICFVVFSIIYYSIGYAAITRTNKLLMKIFLVITVVTIGVNVFGIIVIQDQAFQLSRVSLDVFSGIQLGIDCLTLGVSVVCMKRFNVLAPIAKEFSLHVELFPQSQRSRTPILDLE